MKKYARFWQKLRQQRGWNQSELARNLGLTPTFVSSVERGVNRYSLAQTRRLMEAFTLSADVVLALLLLEEEARIRKALRCL